MMFSLLISLIIDYSISKKLSLSRGKIRNIEPNIRNIDISPENRPFFAENGVFFNQQAPPPAGFVVD
ncbi:MAG: hypothetical protein ACK2TT_00465 [Anaerolineales bacterium]